MSEIVHLLNQLPLAGLMMVVACGYLLGRFAWRGFSLGPAGGTLFVAVACGLAGLDYAHLYSSAEPRITLGAFGFALFLYSIGFEAGPRFFSSLGGAQGWRVPFVAVLVNVLAVVAALACGWFFSFSAPITAGLLSGALTSAPTFAAAMAICDDPDALALAFALTFPVGLVGVVWLTQFLPRVMGDDLAAGSVPDLDDDPLVSPELRRAFEIERPEVIGRPLRELGLAERTGCYVVRLHRGAQVTVPDADTALRHGDHVMAKGRLNELHAFEQLVGREVYDEDLRRQLPSPRAIVVTRPEVIGRLLRDLEIFKRHHCLVTEVSRHGEIFEPTADLCLEADDVLFVVGRGEDLRAIARHLGHFDRASRETDIAVYAGGILFGLAIGQARLPIGGLDLGLGTAGGLLLAGILLGRFQRIGPFSTHVPAAARQLVRDLGILLFVAETGVDAGGGTWNLGGMVWPLVAAAFVVTLVPVAGSVWAARHILGLAPADAWGTVAGGMTSSSALTVIRQETASSEPAIVYAAAYAVASIVAAFAGQVVLYLG